MLISENELTEFLSTNEVSLQDVLNSFIEYNEIIGVGLVTLEVQIIEMVRSLEVQLIEVVRSNIRKG